MEEALAYILIVTRYGQIKKVSNRLLKIPEVENVHELYGQYDIIIKVKLKNISDLETFTEKHLRHAEGIDRTETLIVSDIPS